MHCIFGLFVLKYEKVALFFRDGAGRSCKTSMRRSDDRKYADFDNQVLFALVKEDPLLYTAILHHKNMLILKGKIINFI